jgi:hypothetical protein
MSCERPIRSTLVSFIPLFCGSTLLQVVLKPHRSVKDPDDVNVTVLPHQVDDSVVAPDEDSYVTARRTSVGLPEVRETLENLNSLVDRLHHVEGVEGGCQ